MLRAKTILYLIGLALAYQLLYVPAVIERHLERLRLGNRRWFAIGLIPPIALLGAAEFLAPSYRFFYSQIGGTPTFLSRLALYTPAPYVAAALGIALVCVSPFFESKRSQWLWLSGALCVNVIVMATFFVGPHIIDPPLICRMIN